LSTRRKEEAAPGKFEVKRLRVLEHSNGDMMVSSDTVAQILRSL
jgi:hypothetical protein